MVAAAQRFEERHLSVNIRITWEKRSLHEFGHTSLADLANAFDLLVVDHPMMGEAHAGGLLTDLRPMLSLAQWNDLRDDALGPSFESYLYEEKLYGLPIDAAAPAACSRPNLLSAHGLTEPASWSDLLTAARRGLLGCLAFPPICSSTSWAFASLAEALWRPDLTSFSIPNSPCIVRKN